jgi:tetratricopeptide (TPR) repeat protein
LYLDQHKNERALWAFTEAAKLAPNNGEINYNLASLYEEEHANERALSYLSKIPRSGWANAEHLLAIKCYLSLGRNDQALSLLNRLAQPGVTTTDEAVALAAAILLAMPTRSQADAEPKRIMMLHSFGLRFKPWTDYAEAIRSEISRRARTPVIFHDHSLQNAQLQDDKSDGPFIDYLRALYEEKHPDLIIAFGAPAASFVQRYRDRLFPGTPMVFTAVERRRVQYDKLTENDAVVATRNDFTAAFENILQLLPDTKTIVDAAVVRSMNPPGPT